MARPPRSSRAARKQGQARRRRSTPWTSRNHPLGWTGVRERVRGRWAAEIRVPRTHARLWVARFDLDLQAALAHDAALFCLYGGDRLPSPRHFNFPAAPRPDIPEHVRVGLTRANIKDIATSHARTLAAFFFAPPRLSPAPAAAPPPPAAAAAVAGDGATATTDGSNGINYIGVTTSTGTQPTAKGEASSGKRTRKPNAKYIGPTWSAK